jgi:hypothetical protein
MALIAAITFDINDMTWLRRGLHIAGNTAPSTISMPPVSTCRAWSTTIGGYYFNVEVDDLTTAVVGFWYKFAGTQPFGETQFLRFMDDETEQVSLRWTDISTIMVVNGSGTIQDQNAHDAAIGPRNDNIMRHDAWAFIEAKVTINNSTGSCEVRVDGKTVLNLTNIDTQNSANSTFDRITFRSSTSDDPKFGMAYVCDTTGLTLNDFLGPLQIESLNPTSDGTTNDFSPASGLTNYEMVDDLNTVSDSTYVESSTIGHKDLYGMSNCVVSDYKSGETYDTIHAVRVRYMARRIDAGKRELRGLCRSVATEVESTSTEVYAFWNWEIYNGFFTTDPNGGGAWTQSAVDAAEFGVTIET